METNDDSPVQELEEPRYLTVRLDGVRVIKGLVSNYLNGFCAIYALPGMLLSRFKCKEKDLPAQAADHKLTKTSGLEDGLNLGMGYVGLISAFMAELKLSEYTLFDKLDFLPESIRNAAIIVPAASNLIAGAILRKRDCQ